MYHSMQLFIHSHNRHFEHVLCCTFRLLCHLQACLQFTIMLDSTFVYTTILTLIVDCSILLYVLKLLSKICKKSKLLFVFFIIVPGILYLYAQFIIFIILNLDRILGYTRICCYSTCTTFCGDCRCSLICRKSFISMLILFIVFSNYSCLLVYARAKIQFLFRSV